MLAWLHNGGAAYTGSWSVYLNTGRAISTTAETWAVPEVVCGPLTGAHYRHDVMREPHDASANPFDIQRDFFDINGDGLPDVVTACDGETSWHVLLNQGDGFSPQYLWPSPIDRIRDLNDHDSDNPGGKTFRDTFDIDGDGLVDLVDFTSLTQIVIYHNAGGAWCPSTDATNCGPAGSSNVAPNPTGGHADLLRQMENGIGGTTNLKYRPSTQWVSTAMPFVTWTLTHLDQDDGLCDDLGANCVSGGNHTLSTDIKYSYGLFEPGAREFRGFGTVEQYDAVGNLRTSWFLQDAARKGKTYSVNSYAAGANPYNNLLVYTYDYWDCVDATTGGALDCPQVLPPGQRRWVRLREADHYDTTNYVISKLAFTQNTAWDTTNPYGNVTQSVKGGTGTTSVTTNIEYAANTSAYIVDKPKHVWVTEGSNVLEEKWFTYDGNTTLGQLTKGNVTTVYSWLDQVIDAALPVGSACPQTPQGGVGTCVTTQTAYDTTYGNLTTVVDANGNQTTTTYDTATQIYPYKVKNALNQEVGTSYDPGCGKLVWQTVAYATGLDPTVQPQTQNQYDTFCRLQKMALPDETLTSPHRTYTYYLGTPPNLTTGAPAQPTDIWISEVEPSSPFGVVGRDDLMDALGRHLQTQRDAVVDGGQWIVVEGTATFDARGNATSRYAPYTRSVGAVTGAVSYFGPPGGTGVSAYQYDALNRVTQVTNPDTSRRTAEFNIAWQTTTKDECYNATAGTCPNGGAKAIEKRDAFARVTEKQLYNQDTFETRTGYTYDGLGRLTQTKQGTTLTTWKDNVNPPDTRVIVTYDSLGRKIKLTDPDTGTPGVPGHWKYGYDLAGNLLYQDDPKSLQHVEFTYDWINRVTKKNYYTTTDAYVGGGTPYATITYKYDTPATGDPTVPYSLGRLTRVDDLSGTTWVRAYDVRGRTLTSEKLIKDINGFNPKNAITTYQYNVADHVTQITYPDNEVVVYGYNEVGQATSLRNTNATPTWYLSGLTYDLFGRPRVITHGNNTTDTRTYYDKTQNFRLSTILTKQGTSTTHLSSSYASYLPTGLLTQLNDLRDTSGLLSNTGTFGYDGLGRLTAVTNSPNLNATYGYDTFGNMNLKEGTTLAYSPSPGTTQPHVLAQINGSSTGISHDPNGNRTGKPTQGYGYNLDDRLETVTVGSATVQPRYDYAGRQVLKVVGASITRYYSDLAEGQDSYLTKHYFAAGLRIASQRVQNSQLAALSPNPAVQLADVSNFRPAVVVLLRKDVRTGLVLSVALLGTALLLAPWRRKRVIGIAVRQGHVVAVIMGFTLGTLPWPLMFGERMVQAQTSGTIYHYHFDHLGSTQVITDGTAILGAILQQVRYKPYGEERYRTGASTNKYEFTGYESDATSGLEYAGARFYDPALGMFLTHDPARQFANPYTYTNWNPVNRNDPNGEIVPILIGIIVGAAIAAGAAATAASIDAYLKTGSVFAAFKAGVTSLGSSGVPPGTSYGLQLVDPSDFGKADAREYAISLIPVVGSGYGSYQNFRQGNYASGTVAAAATVLSAYGSYKGVESLYNTYYVDGATQGSSGGASTIGSAGRFALQVAGAVWNLPNTVAGLLYGGLGYGAGWLLGTEPGIGFSYGQIQFTNNPFTSTAITFGDVGIYGTGPLYQPTAFVPGTAFQNQFVEYQHTLQGRVLGPLYLPAHVISGGIGTAYGFATGATDFVGAWHSAANLLEVGPHSTDPRPWW